MFDERENLKEGIHDFYIDDFIGTFCVGLIRENYKKKFMIFI